MGGKRALATAGRVGEAAKGKVGKIKGEAWEAEGKAGETMRLFAAEVAEAVSERQGVRRGATRALAAEGSGVVGGTAEGKVGKAEGEVGEVEGEVGKAEGEVGDAQGEEEEVDDSGDIVLETAEVDVDAIEGVGRAAARGEGAQHRAGEGRRGAGDALPHGGVGAAAAAATSSLHLQALAREASTGAGTDPATRTLSAADGVEPTFGGPADGSAAARWAALRGQTVAGAWQAGARDPAVRAAQLRQRAWLEDDAFGTIMQWLYSRIPNTRGESNADGDGQR